ncbi:MAG: hypothetical protein ACOYLQ_14935 [Hyphomicrobiaceae bacterium]
MFAGFLRSTVAFVSLAGAIAFAYPAHSAELVILPYACQVIRGQPTLTMAENTGHRIVGRRETDTFTACAPSDAAQCRRWTIHRFDMDCGGHIVPWTEVVASSAAQRRAWLEGGNFRLRMPPWWGISRDDPCFAPYAPQDRWRPGGMRRLCAERRARGEDIAANTVVFPAGFAPTFGLDAIFVPAPPGTAAVTPGSDPARTGPGAPKGGVSDPRPERPTSPKVTAGVPAGVAPALPAKPAPTRPAGSVDTASVSPSVSAPGPAPTPPPAPTPAVRPESKAPAEPDSTGTRTLAVVPRILNAPGADTAAAAQPDNKPEPKPAPAVAPERSAGPAAAANRAPGVEPAPAPLLPDSTPPAGSALAAGFSFDRPGLVVLGLGAGAVVLAVSAFVIFGAARRGPRTATGPVERDLGAVRFDPQHGTASRELIPAPAPTGRPVTAPAPPGPPPQNQGAGGGVATIPQTPQDALRVLGLGLGPDADLIAIKKMVDALRFSWHPDRANDADDRQLREWRIRQINAAWEILAAEAGQRRTG